MMTECSWMLLLEHHLAVLQVVISNFRVFIDRVCGMCHPPVNGFGLTVFHPQPAAPDPSIAGEISDNVEQNNPLNVEIYITFNRHLELSISRWRKDFPVFYYSNCWQLCLIFYISLVMYIWWAWSNPVCCLVLPLFYNDVMFTLARSFVRTRGSVCTQISTLSNVLGLISPTKSGRYAYLGHL